jgi:transposase
MTPIPVPVRQRILQLYERGKSTREIAQCFGFCAAAVRRVRQQFQQRGTLQPQTHRSGRRTLLTAERKQRLAKLLCEHPDATLAELGARLDRRFRTSTVDLWLRRLGWRFKKNSGRLRAKPARRGRKRAHGQEQFVSELVHRLVFVDESAAHTKLTRWRGRALGGPRLVGRIPCGT